MSQRPPNPASRSPTAEVAKGGSMTLQPFGGPKSHEALTATVGSQGAVRWGVPVQLGDRRVLHPGRWRWLRALAWLVALFFLTAAAFGLPLQSAVDRFPADDDALRLLAVAGASVAALGTYALSVCLGERRGAREIALRPAAGGLAVGSVLGLVMMGSLMGALWASGLYDVALVGTAPAWAGIALAVQAAVTERAVDAGTAAEAALAGVRAAPGVPRLRRHLRCAAPGQPRATPLAGTTVMMAGLMFCSLYALTGRLWVPIGLHTAWNLAQGYLFGAVVSGNNLGGSIAVSTARPGAHSWLTGGAFGPEGSLLALLLVGGVTTAALWLAHRAGRFTPSAVS